MSRIGRHPIAIPAGVTVTVSDDNHVVVKGPKGQLEQTVNKNITVKVEGNEVHVTRPNDEKQNRAFHGLYRALIANMVNGVSQGYKKTLALVGTIAADIRAVRKPEPYHGKGIRYADEVVHQKEGKTGKK